ncbi:hypothetical protein Z517_11461 [Fonsecaea pedrosoi CBS 271.37]|uniref:Uncharacterized protein n=1 Tax=Fonsecaea pedrosoi CBS 271.37 TaxID=1442368 RepID=A0A0D2DAQ7_9EURO|nr:uncharacterized protein Z517_11461 [Fonsecaea pedrosoi CBS 271.37]KIW74691.1 hypothetical protein Z517_11461 [Fonsecaea pedrosoi CBS 271.37]
MSSDSKANVSFDAASISTSSLMSEKERAKKEKKDSLVKRVVTAIKNFDPPEPRIPKGRHEYMPAWAV